jgi:hypothetical protein
MLGSGSFFTSFVFSVRMAAESAAINALSILLLDLNPVLWSCAFIACKAYFGSLLFNFLLQRCHVFAYSP